MEGSENNPVMFELMSELPWRPTKFGKEEWLKGYVRARYGTDDPTLQEAWQLLGATIYNCPMGNNQQGPHESIFCGRPSANNFQASSWSKMSNYYDPDDILRAATLFASVADKYRGNNNYEYDLVDIVRQAMADQARVQYEQTMASYKSFRRKAFATNSERFLKMLLLQDKFLGTRSEFRLGRWTTQARSLGTTPQEKDLYEWNARVQITTWGNRTCADEGGLRDYAHKEWQGLLKDFYYLRWSTYFRELTKQMEAKSKPDIEKLGSGKYKGMTTDELFSLALEQDVHIDWYAIEEPWTLQHNPYSPQPEGQPVDVAKEVISFLNR